MRGHGRRHKDHLMTKLKYKLQRRHVYGLHRIKKQKQMNDT